MRDRKKMLFPAFLMAVVGLIGIVSASYAWLGVSRVPFISDLSVSVITQTGLVIAPDVDGKPGEWGDVYDTSEYFAQMVPLRPATYTPQAFCRIVYNETGRTSGVVPMTEENFNRKYPEGVDKETYDPWADGEEGGYMVYVDFWLKSDTSANVFLSKAIPTASGEMGGGTYAVGKPTWSESQVRHINGGYGMETMLRMGFDWQRTDAEGTPIGDKSFVMYEPNADIHPDETVGYSPTSSVLGGPLIDDAHLITQKASTWREASPVLADTVVYTAGDFIQERTLLRVEKGGMTKVRLYAWIEGQDPDCIARNVAKDVSITANIQFGVRMDTEDGTGIGRRDLSDITG